MKTFTLAFRNILRNRRRSLATVLAMALGLLTMLLFGGYRRDIGYTLETGYVQRGGHLQLLRRDYFLYGSGNPAAYGISDYEDVIARLKGDAVLGKLITVATPVLQLGGVAGNFAEGASRTVLVTGMDVDGQNHLRQWNPYGTFQRRPPLALTGTPPDAALIGNGVARVLRLCAQLQVANCTTPPKVDDAPADLPSDIAALSQGESTTAPSDHKARIELLAASTNGAPNVSRLQVVMAADQGTKELDDVYVAMHLGQAQKLLYGSQKPKVTAIVLQLHHTDEMSAAKARLAELMTDNKLSPRGEAMEVKDFTDIYPFHRQAIVMFQTMFGFISILIGSIVLFTVSNTMGMAVVERTVEVGTLRAMGHRRAGIRRMFVAEGLLLGALGAVLGVGLALAISTAINVSGVTWVPPGWANSVPFVVRVWGETQLVVLSAVGVLIVAVSSAWWPARRAARLDIVDALRHT